MKKRIYEIAGKWTGLLMVAALATGMLASCSDDDKPAPTGTLPTLADIENAEPGKTYDVTGTAQATWTASSNSTTWCTVTPGTGPAGAFKLEVEVKDAGWGFAQDDVAEITFAYTDTDLSTKFKVTRPAKVMDATWTVAGTSTPVTELVISPEENGRYRTQFSFVTTFPWKFDVDKLPQWIDDSNFYTGSGDPATGEAEVQKNIWIEVIPEMLDTDGLTGEITLLLDVSGSTKSVSIPVAVKPIDAGHFYVTKPFSAIYNAAMDGGFEEDITFTVASASAFGFYALEFDPFSDYQTPSYTGAKADWLSAEPVNPGRAALQGGEYVITAGVNDDAKRAAQLFCMPQSVISSIASPSAMYDAEGLLDTYKKYLVTAVQQAGVENVIFIEEGGSAAGTFRRFYHASEDGTVDFAAMQTTYGTDDIFILEVDNVPSGTTDGYYILEFSNFPNLSMGGNMANDSRLGCSSYDWNNVLLRNWSTDPLSRLRIEPFSNETGTQREMILKIDYYPTLMWDEKPAETAGVIIYRQAS